MNIFRQLVLATGPTTTVAATPARVDAYHDSDAATHQAKITTLDNADYGSRLIDITVGG